MKRRRHRSNNAPKIVGLLAVAAVVVGVAWLWNGHQAVNTGTTPAQRNDLRRSELKMIGAALESYMSQTGPLPAAIPASQTDICVGTGSICKQYGRVDLAFLTSSGYLNNLPNDPVGGHDRYGTGYFIGKTNGKIILTAPRAEAGANISLTLK